MIVEMADSEDWLTVGKLVAAQGLKGEVRVTPRSDFPERFTSPGQRWIQIDQQSPIEMTLSHGRKLPGKLIYIVRFQEINNRKEAEGLIGGKLLVRSIDRPKLNKDEYHLLDLVGLEAKLRDNGASIGKVTNLSKGGNDLLEICLLEGRTVLIPFVKEIVPEVHPEEGWLLLNPPPGLLDL